MTVIASLPFSVEGLEIVSYFPDAYSFTPSEVSDRGHLLYVPRRTKRDKGYTLVAVVLITDITRRLFFLSLLLLSLFSPPLLGANPIHQDVTVIIDTCGSNLLDGEANMFLILYERKFKPNSDVDIDLFNFAAIASDNNDGYKCMELGKDGDSYDSMLTTTLLAGKQYIILAVRGGVSTHPEMSGTALYKGNELQ